LPPTLEETRRLVASGAKASNLRNDLVCVKTVCKQYVDEVARPLRGD
jgi:hypothetical protein